LQRARECRVCITNRSHPATKLDSRGFSDQPVKKKRPSTKEAIKGTWEYSENYSTMKITSGNTPYKTYFSVVKGIIGNAENTARITVYGDGNNNGTFDASDPVIGDATTKTYVAGTSGTKGTFEGSLRSNVTYSYVNGKKVGESTFDKPAWSPIQASMKPASKKNKPIKTPKSGGTKDPITGARWDLDGYELVSDKTYTGLSIPLEGMLFGPNSWDKMLEAEFGDPGLVVFTYKYTYNDSNDPTTGLPMTYREMTIRTAYEGDFTYKKGRLASARIKRVASDEKSTVTWIDGSQPAQSHLLGYISKPANNTGGIVISDANSYTSWVSATAPLQGWGSGLLIPNIAEAHYGTPMPTTAEDEVGVRGYQSGRFFADGWWNNPFTPNLL
jgi:hypothetical protein